MNENLNELIDTVIKNDYCSGCGICASLNGSPFTMKLDENGMYRPSIEDCIENAEMKVNVLDVCPFSNNSKNETEIGKEVFSQYNDAHFNEYTGYYIKNYAGYVREGDFRKKGSSGGMGNWISTQLLKNNLVDGIIHVKPSNRNNKILFEYQISYNEEDLSLGAKSKYYPVEMSQVIQLVKENEGRYALIGIPCFIKSIRLLAKQDQVIKERIKYFIGLVCGHLKSDMFAKSLAWQIGIKPDELNRIDFRKKLKGRRSSDYGVEVEGIIEGKEKVLSSPTRELYTTNWGHGLFQYNACQYCDDVLAETADVTVGDAWLPEYLKDGKGTNIITVRNPDIQEIFEGNSDQIFIEELSPEKIYQSQIGGFRHRRDGLAYRLYLKDANNEWRPQKRVEPHNKMSSKRKQIYKTRMLLSQESFKAYKKAEKEEDFNVFITYMNPIIKQYNKLYKVPIFMRILNKIKRTVLRK